MSALEDSRKARESGEKRKAVKRRRRVIDDSDSDDDSADDSKNGVDRTDEDGASAGAPAGGESKETDVVDLASDGMWVLLPCAAI